MVLCFVTVVYGVLSVSVSSVLWSEEDVIILLWEGVAHVTIDH